MREKFQKIMSYITVFIMLFANPVTMIFANAEEAKSSVKIGIDKDQNYFDADNKQELDAGDIVVTKSVEPTEEEGVYRVSFTVTGKENTESVTHPLYIVVILDTSNSMTIQKMKDAKEGIINFTHELASTGANKFAFVKFDNTATKVRSEFSTSEIGNSELPGNGNVHSGTKYMLALTAAREIIDAATIPANAKTLMVLVSDGSPDDYKYLFENLVSGSITSPTQELTQKQDLLDIKNGKNGTIPIDIYTIGYAIDQETNPTWSEAIIRNVSTDINNNYVAASEGELKDKLQDLAEELKKTPAAENIKIKEVPAANFTIVGSDEKDIELDGQAVTFDIRIDESLEDGTYPTNDIENTVITYTGVDGQEHEVKINDTPSINWTKPTYNYTVNYYKDNTEGNPFKSTSGTGYLNEEIQYENTCDDPAYEFTTTSGQTTITKNANDNVLNVIFTKKEVEYKVIYHYENLDSTLNDVEDPKTYTGIYGETIDPTEFIEQGAKEGFEFKSSTQSPETLQDGENVLHIVYSRKSYNYCIKYYYDNEEDEDSRVTGNEYFGTMITYDNKDKDGFVFSKVNPSNGTLEISSNEEENIIEVYYVKKAVQLKEEPIIKPETGLDY